jgi:hypothetical protein
MKYIFKNDDINIVAERRKNLLSIYIIDNSAKSGSKRKKVTGNLKELHSDALHNLPVCFGSTAPSWP